MNVWYWLVTGTAIYVLAFVAVMWLQIAAGGPATFGLILVRTVLWPLFVFWGIPAGRRNN